MTREEIRRENARKLASGKGGKAAFARLVQMEASQVSQIIGPKPVKNIGNSIARRIEQAYELPEGWLDAAHPEPLDSSKSGSVATSAIESLESETRSSARRDVDIAAALDVDPAWLANGLGADEPAGQANDASTKPEDSRSAPAGPRRKVVGRDANYHAIEDVSISTETTLERLDAREKLILELYRRADKAGKLLIHSACVTAANYNRSDRIGNSE